MLTCRDVTEIVTDYLEGRQSLIERFRFQMHLGMCRPCREYLRQMRVTVRALGALARTPAPPEVPAELLQRLRDWRR
jgi:predicted anti-sigma-YlaC factor YlaD